MSELVVFTARENFDFLKFSSRCPVKQQEALKADCVTVQETQKLTAQTFGVWALRLVDLRDGGCWEDVINPETGYAFYNDGFGAFCKHAFGLSETATSNLTKVAQFIQNHGDNVGALDERYRGYSFSQLVELSSVSPETHKFFNPTMTVKDMRVAKDYIKHSVEFRFEDKGADYDLLAKAQAWKDNGSKTSEPKIEVIPGQINLDDITDSVTVDVNPTSDLANDGVEEYEDEYEEDENSPEYQEYLRQTEPWIELTEEKKELAIKITLIDRAGYVRRKLIYEKYQENPTRDNFINFIKSEYGNSGFGVDFMGSTDSKGYKIEPFRGDWVIFLSWAQVASRIVALINRGEYYTEMDEVNPTSDLANAGVEEIDIYDMPMQTHSYDSDDCDESDEAYEDMQAEMQTIEEESERSLPPLEEKSAKEYDFSTRDNIRLFLNDYENWYYRDDIRTPFTKYCYCITLPNFDMVYAFEMNVATGATLEGKQEHATEVEYFIFLQSQYYYKEMPNVFKITKRDLEGYLMAHRDELKRR